MNLNTLIFKSPVKVVFVVIVLLASCRREEHRHNEISKIEVATGDCFGPCQLTAISIDSQLTVNYFGGELLPGKPRKVFKGNFTGKINQELWDTLNSKLERINYKQLDTSYENSVDDQSLEMIVYYSNNKIKHVRAQSASLPDSVRDVFYWVANAYKSVKLEPSNKQMKFNTTLQEYLLPPVKVDRVKFPLIKSK